MCFCVTAQPPTWVTRDAPPSPAMWEDSTIHVDVSVSPSQGKYTDPQTLRIHCQEFKSIQSTLSCVCLVCFFHSISSEPNKTQVFSFFQTDLGGLLPRSVVDSFFPSSMAEFYTNLAKAVKSLKGFWHQELTNLLNRGLLTAQTIFIPINTKIIIDYLVQKGLIHELCLMCIPIFLRYCSPGSLDLNGQAPHLKAVYSL